MGLATAVSIAGEPRTDRSGDARSRSSIHALLIVLYAQRNTRFGLYRVLQVFFQSSGGHFKSLRLKEIGGVPDILSSCVMVFMKQLPKFLQLQPRFLSHFFLQKV
jgi:hypothetical protein